MQMRSLQMVTNLERFVTLHIVHRDTVAGAKNISIREIYIVIQPTLRKLLQDINGLCFSAEVLKFSEIHVIIRTGKDEFSLRSVT